MKHKDLVPGCKLIRTSVCTCRFLVILLSSDIESGFGPHDNWWRCASFQIGSNNTILMGAQIELHTVHELFQMEHLGGIDYLGHRSKESDSDILDTKITFKGHPVLLGPDGMNRKADKLDLTRLDRCLFQWCPELYKMTCDTQLKDTMVDDAAPWSAGRGPNAS